jgi:hypothetical protein
MRRLIRTIRNIVAAAAFASLLGGLFAAQSHAEIGRLSGPKEFQVKSDPSYSIRHYDFIGRVTKRIGPLEDFVFDVVQYRSTTEDPRRSDRYFPLTNVVRLRSRNFPGRYLRHKNFRLVLDEPGDANFGRDSLFHVVRGLYSDGLEPWIQTGDWKNTPRNWSFESYNFPGRYIHARMSQGFRLWLDRPSGRNFARESTFVPNPGPPR